MSKLKKSLAALLLVFLYTSCLSSKDKAPEGGWLWKISGNGLEKPSYLFGTWHGSFDISYDYVDSIPGFHVAFDACNQCITEVNLTNESNSLSSLPNIKMPADTTYADLLDETAYRFLDSLTQNTIGAPLDKMQASPVFLSMILHQVKQIKTLLEAGYSQGRIDTLSVQVMDARIENIAKEKNYTLVGLETLQQQMELMTGPESGLKEQAVQLVASWQANKKNPAVAKALTEKLAYTYRSQDIEKLVEYEAYSDSVLQSEFSELKGMDALYIQEKMLKERNTTWAEKLPALIREHPSFIAVGVRHLAGENGLIALLRQAGYRVEAVK